MRFKLLILMALATLSACVPMQGGIATAGRALCANRDAMTLSYSILLQNAVFVADPVIRESMIGTAQAGLKALSECPLGPQVGQGDS